MNTILNNLNLAIDIATERAARDGQPRFIVAQKIEGRGTYLSVEKAPAPASQPHLKTVWEA